MAHNLPETEQNNFDNHADKKSNDSQREPGEGGFGGVGRPEAKPSEGDPDNRQEHSRTKHFLSWISEYKAAIETCGVIVVMLYTGAAFWQGREAQRSANAAFQSAQAARDAAIAAKNANIKTQAALDQNRKQFELTLDQMKSQTGEEAKAANAARGQLAEAHRDAELDQRAWMGLDSITQAIVVVGSKVSFQINIRNFGRTPASDVSVKGAFRTFPGLPQAISPLLTGLIEHPPRPRLDLNEVALATNGGSKPVIVPGTEEQTILTSEDKLTGNEYNALTATFSQTLYLWGAVTYMDVFGRQHRTQFCYWWNPPSSGFNTANPLVFCADRNFMN